MKVYRFYARIDSTKETISKTLNTSRLKAAQYFAKKKKQ